MEFVHWVAYCVLRTYVYRIMPSVFLIDWWKAREYRLIKWQREMINRGTDLGKVYFLSLGN